MPTMPSINSDGNPQIFWLLTRMSVPLSRQPSMCELRTKRKRQTKQNDKQEDGNRRQYRLWCCLYFPREEVC